MSAALFLEKILNKESLKALPWRHQYWKLRYILLQLFSALEETSSEEESQKLELEILEYHS
jgi:hypothetical protein